MISLPLALLILAVWAAGYGLGVYDRHHNVPARLDRNRQHTQATHIRVLPAGHRKDRRP